LGRKFLFGNDNIQNKVRYVGEHNITNFLKKCWNCCSGDKYQPILCNTYNNATSLETYAAANKPSISESAFPSFFGQASGRCYSWSSAPEF